MLCTLRKIFVYWSQVHNINVFTRKSNVTNEHGQYHRSVLNASDSKWTNDVHWDHGLC